MSAATATWLAFFGILFYVFSIDANVQEYLSLLWVRFNQIRTLSFYSLLWDPRYPWVRWRIRRIATRNSNVNAKLLAKELGIEE